jgi:hypothetical protein
MLRPCIGFFLLLLGAPALGLAAPASKKAPGESIRMTVAGKPATVRSSSTLPSKPPGRYSVANLFDEKLETAWVEGAPGPGNDEWIEIEFDEPVELDGYLIAPGYGKSRKAFLENVAPFQLEIRDEEQRLTRHELRYPMRFGCVWTGEPSSWGPRLVVLDQPATVKVLRLTVQKGAWSDDMRAQDLAISEFRPILAGLPAEGSAPHVWKPLVRFSANLVRGLRSRAFEKSALAADVQVDDVFEVAEIVRRGNPDFGERLARELRSTGAQQKRPRTENFAEVARGALLNAAVTLLGNGDEVALVGERLFNIGPKEYDTVAVDTVLRLAAVGDSYEVRQMRLIVEELRCNGAILPDPAGAR